MANRGGSKPSICRAPLGDATDRVVNASPQKPGKQSRRSRPEPNPLRAHATNSVAQRRTASKTSLMSNSKGANVRSDVHPQVPGLATTSGVDEVHGDKRFSQISASSGASSGNRKTHIGPWQLGKTLGKGSAARVRLARHRTTQDTVAVKILAKNMTQLTAAGSMAELDKWDRTRDEFNSQRQMPLSIEREVAILKLIDHPNIVKLYDIWENRAEM
jgi:serine/threonine-protein kinase HSL1, negative regulator of Swe1 kinase